MRNIPPSALRQPPPPGHCLLIDSTTSRRDGDASRVRSLPFYFRRRKNANPSNSMIESLPDELLIEILLRLSADEIYDNARLVCRRWRRLIHTDAFVREHLHRSSSGLLLTDSEAAHPILVTATAEGRVEISELSCRINFPIVCSCNGLVLCLREDSGSRERIPFIFNPATKCAFYLLRFPVTVIGNLVCSLGMAYAAASMAYKVVRLYLKSETVVQCGILTVGVDNSWRHLALEGLSPEAMKLLMSFPTSLMTGGLVNWVSETRVVSLNVETEIFTYNPTSTPMFPPDYEESKYDYWPLSTGEYLSLFVTCEDWFWEVWEMKPGTWEWRKVLCNLDIEALECKFEQFAAREDDVLLRLLGWVRYPNVLALCNSIGGSYVIYNFDTNEINTFKLSTECNYQCDVQHRNSLVWLQRC